MAYSNISSNKEATIIKKILTKFGKFLAKSFPLNSIRILGLKLAGFAIGRKVYIGGDLIVASLISEKSCTLVIKDRVAIGPRVTLILSSDANWSNLMEIIQPIRGSIIIEEDAWIGAGAIVLPNIIIGKSAVVGAGSIVTKDVPAKTVVAGNPARFIKNI